MKIAAVFEIYCEIADKPRGGSRIGLYARVVQWMPGQLQESREEFKGTVSSDL